MPSETRAPMRACAALATLTYVVCAAHGCSRDDDDDDVSSTRSVDSVEAAPVDDATAESATAESATAESATATSTTDAGQLPEPPASTSASAGTTPSQSRPLDAIEVMGGVPTAGFTWFAGLGNWFIVQSGHIRDAVVEPL